MTSDAPNPLANGVTADLYKAAIGPIGQDYYLRQFFKFDAHGRTSASWHWPACCATLNWLIFRKMWGLALAYGVALVALALLVFGAGKLLFNYSEATGLLLLLLFLSAACVWPGRYANAWFYTHCNQRISAALRDTADLTEACAALAGQASSTGRWRQQVVANVAALALMAGVGGSVWDFVQARVSRASPQSQPAPQPAVQVAPAAAPVAAAPASAVAAPSMEARVPAPAIPRPPEPVQMAAAHADEQAPASGAGKRAAAATDDAAQAEPSLVNPKKQWFVQVGAFASDANAQSVRARIKATGLASTAQVSDTPAGRLIRVRVGPFDSKDEAERAALRIKALELPAVLVRQ
jgi:cell division septation protein DedD